MEYTHPFDRFVAAQHRRQLRAFVAPDGSAKPDAAALYAHTIAGSLHFSLFHPALDESLVGYPDEERAAFGSRYIASMLRDGDRYDFLWPANRAYLGALTTALHSASSLDREAFVQSLRYAQESSPAILFGPRHKPVFNLPPLASLR